MGGIRWAVPSMYHRRLLLVATGLSVLTAGLSVRLAALTLVHGQEYRDKAESVLTEKKLLPTARGRILDRRMRVLAQDKPDYVVSVRFPVITGQWAYEQASEAAYRANRERWTELDDEAKDQLVAAFLPAYDRQVEQMWQALSRLGRVPPDQLEQRKTTIVRRVNQIASSVWAGRLRERAARYNEPVRLIDVAQPIGEQVAYHEVLTNLDSQALIAVQGLIDAAKSDPALAVWEQVQVEPSKTREYPLETMTVVLDRSSLPGPLRSETPVEMTVEGVAAHVVGSLRGVLKEDVDRRPYRRGDGAGQAAIDLAGYLPGDRVGSWGIERSQEERLRGRRGQVVRHIDSSHEVRDEPVPGEDVVLTIDVALQSRVQAVMDPRLGLTTVQRWHGERPAPGSLRPQPGEPLNGAAVVLDVTHGHVLAAVSLPGISLGRLKDDPDSIWGDKVNQPWVNRVVAMPYQPGSTIKPVALVAGVTEGVVGERETIDCRGHLDPEVTNRYRCWIYKAYNSVHGPLNGDEALARSCNIYFYTVGRRLGAARLVRWYSDFGLGATTGCGLKEEAPGDLPDLSRASDPAAGGFSADDAVLMAIGQGRVRWTLLQAVGAYATIARGGRVVSPTFVMSQGQGIAPQKVGQLALNRAAVAETIEGLGEVVQQRYGTAHALVLLNEEPIFNLPGVRVFGKSGTAQASPLWVDQNGDHRFTSGVDKVVRKGDHAWMICLVQRPSSEQPDYAVGVVLEYAGSGAMVAGPVVNQILHAMRAEGYL